MRGSDSTSAEDLATPEEDTLAADARFMYRSSVSAPSIVLAVPMQWDGERTLP